MSETLINRIFMGAVLLMCVLGSCNSCSHASQEAKTARAIVRIDSTLSTKVGEGRLDTVVRAEGLRVSKRMLYGQNAVLRTTERPDDLMNQYDQELDSLTR